MRKLLAALLTLAFVGSASAQTLQNLPPNTVVGRLGAGTPGPAQAIPFATLSAQLGSSGGGGGGAGASNITRAQIPSNNLSAQSFVTVNGYATANDRGYGATYTSVGSNCTTGLEYILDSVGTCFNLVINTTTGVNIGWFGAKGDGGSTTIASSDITANPQWRGTYPAGTTWDTVGAQEGLYAAFAINSTPHTLVWNVNSGLNNFRYFVPKGAYGINQTLFTAMSGFTIEFDSRLDTQFNWLGPAGVKMWLFDAASYGLFINFTNINSAGQSFTALTPTVSFDHDGASPGGLLTQQLTFINATTIVASNGLGIAINNVAGSAGQGDTITFLNPYCGGDFASAQACIKVNGNNTLELNIIGGDCQGFVHTCVQIFGGTVYSRGFHFENENNNNDFVAPSLNQVNTSGADFWAFGAPASTGPNILEGARSEAEILSDASGGSFTDVYSSTNTTSDIANWVSGAEQLAGFMVFGGTKVRTFMVVDNGSVGSAGACPGWCLVTGGFGTTTLVDSAATYVTNALVNSNLWLRDTSGIVRACTISANTATTITSPCTVRTGLTLNYQVGGNTGVGTPSWDAASAGYKGNGAAGAQVVTTAGSTCVGLTNFPAGGGTVSIGDWLIIPHADQVNPGGGNPIWDNALYAKVTATGSGACGSGTSTANNVTINRAATVTTNLLSTGGWVYGCTPVALDGAITWCNVNWSAVTGGGIYGNTTLTGSVTPVSPVIGLTSSSLQTNPTGSWFDSSLNGVGGPINSNQPLINFLPGQTETWPCALAFAATIDVTKCVNSANVITLTVTGNVTLNAPATTALSQEVTYLLLSNGTNFTVTFGTNFASNGTLQTGTGGLSVVTFRSRGVVASNWVEVSRSTANAAGTNATVAAPAGPNSTSAFTMQGLAGTITPKKTGNLNLAICGTITETGITAAGSGIQYQLSYGTGTAPLTNAALAGTQIGTVQEYMLAQTVTAADVFVPFCQTAIVTGLILGTPYWIDLAAEAVANTGFALTKVNVAAQEF